MPFYRVNGMTVHINLGGRKRGPAPCRAPIELEGRRVYCCGISTALCDWPLEEGGTCSMPICPEHSTHVGADEDLCPKHAAGRAAKTPELF